jgi:sulfide:quinone oxidoreductase
VASEALLVAFEERGITFHGNQLVQELDPAARVARLAGGGEMPFDLFLGVPVHRAPEVVESSGMTVDGWIPVDPYTLETTHPDVYAVGDVTSVGTPKAGVFAEGQAAVVADAIIARARGAEAGRYDGRGICYLEFGQEQVAKVDVIFEPGQAPRGDFLAPSEAFMADKREFGSSRIQRWFGRTWP